MELFVHVTAEHAPVQLRVDNCKRTLPEHKQQRTTGQVCIEVMEAVVDDSHFSLLSYDRPIGGTEGWVCTIILLLENLVGNQNLAVWQFIDEPLNNIKILFPPNIQALRLQTTKFKCANNGSTFKANPPRVIPANTSGYMTQHFCAVAHFVRGL